MDTAGRFSSFASVAASGGSPVYAAWASGVAGDEGLLAIVERVAESQRQPVLVFGVARILGCSVGPFAAFREWVLTHADRFVDELARRLTQTNDARRAAPVALALTLVDGPVTLLEVGASAGLGLLPDRYSTTVRTNGGVAGLGDASSGVRLELRVDGPIGRIGALPRVAARAGTDVAPLSPRSPADALWLETLLWPGQHERVALLRAALRIAAEDPGMVRSGDAVDSLESLVAEAPAGTTPVVVTAGTLVYLPGARRQAFVDLVDSLGARWISYERTGLLTAVQATVPDRAAADDDFATLALDGRALAVGDAHGTRLTWFA